MLPLSKHSIEVFIVDDSKAEKCDIGCGMDWSSAETVALADQQIKARFGDRVQLKYLDLSQAVTGYLALDLQQRIGNGNLPLPLLLINGEPRISGPFDIRMLLDAVEAEIEMKPENKG